MQGCIVFTRGMVVNIQETNLSFKIYYLLNKPIIKSKHNIKIVINLFFKGNLTEICCIKKKKIDNYPIIIYDPIYKDFNPFWLKRILTRPVINSFFMLRILKTKATVSSMKIIWDNNSKENAQKPLEKQRKFNWQK